MGGVLQSPGGDWGFGAKPQGNHLSTAPACNAGVPRAAGYRLAGRCTTYTPRTEGSASPEQVRDHSAAASDEDIPVASAGESAEPSCDGPDDASGAGPDDASGGGPDDASAGGPPDASGGESAEPSCDGPDDASGAGPDDASGGGPDDASAGGSPTARSAGDASLGGFCPCAAASDSDASPIPDGPASGAIELDDEAPSETVELGIDPSPAGAASVPEAAGTVPSAESDCLDVLNRAEIGRVRARTGVGIAEEPFLAIGDQLAGTPSACQRLGRAAAEQTGQKDRCGPSQRASPTASHLFTLPSKRVDSRARGKRIPQARATSGSPSLTD